MIGVLDLQGDVIEHVRALERCGAEVLRVKTTDDLEKVDGLILPGGESTAIQKLLDWEGVTSFLVTRIKQGMPVWGTCAGAILLEQWKLLNVAVDRNAYGGQLDSFETAIEANLNNEKSEVHGIFIRAPKITSVGQNVEVLAEFGPDVVMIRQGNILATTFHPELTDDDTIHQYFLTMIHESS